MIKANGKGDTVKITFLGTSAGESYPGLWCECPHCQYARAHGGRNRRNNSCALVDEVLLLDMGIGCFDTAARLGISLRKVEALLVTHPHEDHLYPQHLYWRMGREETFTMPFVEQMRHGGPRFTPLPQMTVYGNADTEARLAPYIAEGNRFCLRFERIYEAEAFTQSGYTITPVRGNHHTRGFAHSYILEKDGRKLLYALDTGLYEEDMEAVLKAHVFNLIIMEGTGGLGSPGEGHMSLAKNARMLDFFVKNGCYAPDARFVLTHLSPHWTPPHDIYVSIAEKEGMMVAYDGMEIDV